MAWTPLNERVANTRRPAHEQAAMILGVYVLAPMIVFLAFLLVIDRMVKP
jgi:hypothetical protein